MTVLMERGCFERGCACYDDRVDKDYVEVDEVRKYISTSGEIVMVREESDDLIATLEQENKQLRARIDRLQREQRPANDSQVDVMWRLCNGNPFPFARMLESYHGIGEKVENV